MNFLQAQIYAERLRDWMAPHCERIEIAGSVRRERPNCNDVDIVAIPRFDLEKDLYGAETGRRNLLWEFQADYVKHQGGSVRWLAGGDVAGKMASIQLRKVQLDVWFATTMNFGSQWLCRTGSKEHNVWICERAIERGGKWSYNEGLRLADGSVIGGSEASIYEALGLSFIEPENREIEWIRKHIEGGL